jgi:transcriptional regulator with XRE-family HTH domain
LRELREIRLRRGLSQADLSAMTGVAEFTISGIESGKRANPRPSTLRKLAQGLGVEVTDLYGELDSPLGIASPSQEKLFKNGGLEEERRLHYLKPWARYVNLLANNVEHEIDKGHVTDLNWWLEFNRDVISLTYLYGRILPPDAEQSEDERLELLKLSDAIDRLNEVAEKMERAMEPVIAEMHKELHARERERRKATFNAIPKRRSA